MKHYKDDQNNLFGYEDGDVVPAGLTEITMEEVNAINISKQLPPTAEEIDLLRRAAYITEADPLFFKWQAGESTEALWRAKREEIRARYPDPVQPEPNAG